MSPSAVPSGSTICQSALAPGSSFPLSSGPAKVPALAGTMRRRPCGVSPRSSRSPRVASRRKTRVRRGSGSRFSIDLAANRIVGMGLKRRHRDPQPVGERQLREQSVELSRALCSVQADGGYPVVDSRPSPQPDEMALVCQRSCSRRLGLLPGTDFGFRCPRWNPEIKLDEKLGHVGRSDPACSATM